MILASVDSEINALVTSLEAKHDAILEVSYRKPINPEQDSASAVIHAIQVKKSNRGEGVGSSIMKELINFADDHGLILLLTPSTDFGATSVNRLRRFYGQFGFKRNLGKFKDYRFSEAMIRQPFKPKSVKALLKAISCVLADNIASPTVASYDDWKGKGWIHYSSVPYLKINPKPFHQDPSGIYLFPKDFKTIGNWKNYPYRFEVEVPSTLRVLDLAKLSEEDARGLVVKLTKKEPRIEPSEYSSYQDQAWENLTNHYGRTQPHKFNKDLRAAGYDAVFDDTGSVHTSEVQLIVLDPTKVKVVKMNEPSDSGFDDVVFVMDHLAGLAKDYKVTMEKPVKKKGMWDVEKKVRGRVTIKNGENEVVLAVTPEKTGGRKDQKWSDEIVVYLEWSKPRLEMSYGARFDRTGRDLTKIDQEIKIIFKKVFQI